MVGGRGYGVDVDEKIFPSNSGCVPFTSVHLMGLHSLITSLRPHELNSKTFFPLLQYCKQHYCKNRG